MNSIFKYPRTHHITGSRFQPGDEALKALSWQTIQQHYSQARIVVEEKMDGANAGISCTSTGELLLQSRGHYLVGGNREKHFHLFKQWANQYRQQFYDALGDSLVLYGEWLYAKHTIFYDALPHYFLEFDIYDTKNKVFFSTLRRQQFLRDYLPMISSVPILYQGTYPTLPELKALIVPSTVITAQWLNHLEQVIKKQSLQLAAVVQETDQSGLMEGLYIKIEDDTTVLNRYKYIRPDFLLTVIESETHWLNRPIVPNQLKHD